MQIDRCPKALVARDWADEAQFAADAMAFREHRLAPNTGGMLDQDPRFLEALALVDTEIARLKAVPSAG